MSYVKGSQLPSTSTVADTDTLIVTQEGDSKATKKVAKKDLLKEDRTRLTNLETDNTTNKSNITNLQNSLGNKAEKNHNHDNVYSKLEHTHNYAGSSSAGGSATSAIKDSEGNTIKDTYLKKSGGSVTGDITLNNKIRLVSKDKKGTEKALIWMNDATNGEVVVGGGTSPVTISIPTVNDFKIWCSGTQKNYDIYHSGNFNPSNYLSRSGQDGINLNTCYDVGIYFYTDTTPGSPSKHYGHMLNTVSYGNKYNGSNNWLSQLAFNTDDTIWHRSKVNSNEWTNWTKLVKTTDLNNYLPKSGGTLTGNLKFSNTTTGTKGIVGTIGDNDYWRVVGNASSLDNGSLELATADDGNEPIVASQYIGEFATRTRRMYLLDSNGDTIVPGNIGLENTKQILGKDTSGAYSNLIKMDGVNQVNVGDAKKCASVVLASKSAKISAFDGTNTYTVYHSGNFSKDITTLFERNNGTINKNINTCFNSSSGKFTAPEAGQYLVMCSGYELSSSSSEYVACVLDSSSSNQNKLYTAGSSGFTLITLNKGQTLAIYTATAGNMNKTCISSNSAVNMLIARIK